MPTRRPSSIASSPTSRPTFDDALDAYRDAMLRARRHLIERDLVTVPDDERIDVIATPEYLRNVIPFAAYFEPATFDRDPKGIYIVTPSVARRPERDARAQLRLDQQHQHPRGLSGPPPPARRRSPQPVADAPARRRARVRRGLGDVLGADDARARLRRRPALPAGDAHRRDLAGLPDHPRRPDAPRRADAPTRRPTSSIEHTSFERPNAAAEVQWYTYRPTYPLSYLLGRTLLLGLRADEQRRLGRRGSASSASTTRCCATGRCRSASTDGC